MAISPERIREIQERKSALQKPQITAIKTPDMANGFQDLERQTVFTVNEQMINALLFAINGNPADQFDRKLARQLLPLGFQSANLYMLAKENSTAIYMGHKSKMIKAAENGKFETTISVSAVPGKQDVYVITYSHKQNGREMGKGDDTILLDPHPYLPPWESSQPQAKAELPKTNLNPVVYLGKTFTGRSYAPRQTDVNLYANITGDHNRAHTDSDYMRSTRFKLDSTIVHGECAGSASVLSFMKELRQAGIDGELSALSFTFARPVITDKTIITPTGVEIQHNNPFVRKFELNVLNQEEKTVIKGWADLQNIRTA